VNGWLLALVGLLARTVARAHRRMRARTATLQQLGFLACPDRKRIHRCAPVQHRPLL
jgi:hypothetical protein